MNKLYLYNTLTRQREEFRSLTGKKVGLYTCGPTVYNFAHLGNLRTYIFEDLLKRVLFYNGYYKVKHVMNITDVGHLIGDRDMGEDKIEVGARRERKTVWEIAAFYTKAFKEDIKKLNILEPDVWCKATDNIKEQIALIKKLEKKGYTYKTSDGIYFDTAKFKDYAKLSHQNLEKLKEGARVEKNPEKKNFTDFALWKFFTPFYSPLIRGRVNGGKRQMEWESPWGVGFPGWHIECSAMGIKFLGKQFAIHCGGVDHINIHHTNEIAQSEAATGKKPWVKYWLHGAFLNIVGGKKMAKSAENFLTLENALIKKGINPLVYRYACLNTHYRKPMEYSDEAMRSAKRGLEHLYNQIRELQLPNLPAGYRPEPRALAGRFLIKNKKSEKFKVKFLKAINDDLNMPKALAVIQELLKSKLSAQEKLVAALDFDKVLGLDLKNVEAGHTWRDLPEKIKKLAAAREKARKEKKWPEADKMRREIEKMGYIIEDTKRGIRVKRK